MKLFRPIFVLSLITLTNITQAVYVVLDDGKATTSTSTCLKLNTFNALVLKECGDANEFTLQDNKFCSKKTTGFCLSKAIGQGPSRTDFSRDENRHIAIKELNEAGGYFHVDSFGGVIKKYKYSVREKMFITDYVEPITFPSTDGHWKINTGAEKGLCWTGGYEGGVVYPNKCRSADENKKRKGNKIQFWKYDYDVNNDIGYIKSADGVMCLLSQWNKIFTRKCNLNRYSSFVILPDREIVVEGRSGMCLVSRIDGRNERTIIKVAPCARRVKFVSSIE